MAKAFKDVPLRDPPPLDDDGLAAVPSATSNFGLGAVKHVRGMPGLPTNAVLNVLQIVGRHRSCRVVVLSGAQWIAALTAAFIGACDRYVALLYSPLLVRVPFARTTVPFLYLTHSRSFFPFCVAFHFPQLILFIKAMQWQLARTPLPVRSMLFELRQALWRRRSSLPCSNLWAECTRCSGRVTIRACSSLRAFDASCWR